MRRPGPLIAILAMLVLCGIFAVTVAGRPDAAFVSNPKVIAALRPMGLSETSWQTVIVYASRDVDLPPERLFATWAALERWPDWQPLVGEARWIDTPGWRAGARFEQVLRLGFPLNRFHSRELVGAVEPNRRVSWWKDENGVRSHQVWSFEPLPDGGTRLTDFQILHGATVGLLRPVIENRWQGLFDHAVDGLIQETRRHK